MDYTDAARVVGLLPGVATITGSSRPLTFGEVASVIHRTAAEIDGTLLGAGYDLPVPTTSNGFAVLEGLNTEGAAWRCLRTIYPNQGGPGDRSSLAQEYKDHYESMLALIRSRELMLEGVTTGSSESYRTLPRSFGTSQPQATAAQSHASPAAFLGRVF